MKKLKTIPKFKSEDEERDFWAVADTSEYFDYSKARQVIFPNLKLSTESISLRLPLSMLNGLKVVAKRQDVPYQSLIKVYIAEKLRDVAKDTVYKGK